MGWNKNYKKEQQPKIIDKKLVIVSQATLIDCGNGIYKGAILVKEDGLLNAWITKDLYNFTQALDKAHYANANFMQYGRELPAGWEQGLQGLSRAEAKVEGFAL